MRFGSDFEPWQKVHLDDDASLVATVTAFSFRPSSDGGTNCLVEVSYAHNGEAKVAWIEPRRLSKV